MANAREIQLLSRHSCSNHKISCCLSLCSAYFFLCLRQRDKGKEQIFMPQSLYVCDSLPTFSNWARMTFFVITWNQWLESNQIWFSCLKILAFPPWKRTGSEIMVVFMQSAFLSISLSQSWTQLTLPLQYLALILCVGQLSGGRSISPSSSPSSSCKPAEKDKTSFVLCTPEINSSSTLKEAS